MNPSILDIRGYRGVTLLDDCIRLVVRISIVDDRSVDRNCRIFLSFNDLHRLSVDYSSYRLDVFLAVAITDSVHGNRMVD